MGRDEVSNMIMDMTRAVNTWQGTTRLLGHMFGIMYVMAKRPFLCGPFGITRSRSMNGEPPLPWSSFPSNAFSASLALVN